MDLNSLSEDEREEFYAITAALDFTFYTEYVHRGQYQHGRHTREVCRVLEDVERGKIDRLMVFMPPRHSKSMTISETFPSWFIGRDPSRKVITVSYGDALARRFGRANRRKVREFAPKAFGIQLDKENAGVSNWGVEAPDEDGDMITTDGQMISAGIGGPISGEGAHLLIIDDPIKNRKEANSPAYREMVWDEWRNTLLTRLQPGASVVIVLTRWHEDDLAGRLLEQEGDRWTVLSLPAEAEPEDPLGREVGEPLWPRFGFDTDWMEQKKKDVGAYVWASLYQQRPSPQEGGIIKRGWFRWYDPDQLDLSTLDEIVQSWDMAFKDKADSSYVVGQVWGRKGADKFALDQVRARMDFPETLSAVRRLTEHWPQALAKLVEDKANGPAVISVLKREISGLIPISPQGSKEARLHAAAPDVRSGNVFLPRGESWAEGMKQEITSFPNATYDDQADAFSQTINYFNEGASKSVGVW